MSVKLHYNVYNILYFDLFLAIQQELMDLEKYREADTFWSFMRFPNLKKTVNNGGVIVPERLYFILFFRKFFFLIIFSS